MRNVIRSKWFRSALALTLLLFVAQCGDESDIVIDQELQCLGEDFAGGAYTFTVNSVSDDCGLGDFGLLDEFVSPGDQFGPVVLPSAQQLPPTIDIPFDPPLGTVTVAISLQGDRFFVMTTEPITIPVNPPVTGTVSGNLCPVEGDEIVSGFNIVTTAPIPCNIRVGATGT